MQSNHPSITIPNNGSFPGKTFYLSPQGMKEIKQEYENFRKLRASETQEDLDLLEARLAEIEHILKNVKLIKRPPKNKQDIIDLGAKILVEVQGHSQNFELVGSLEIDPDLGKISNESPVGEALLGHRAGDKVALTASPTTIYKIKKISY